MRLALRRGGDAASLFVNQGVDRRLAAQIKAIVEADNRGTERRSA
jgi:hypothetical protein